ncbi:MAG: hypothetical protein RMY16_12620 [Nostoc sp. DedQUE12b]|uniref:hypothetical protein n=1 Tax=Nostoc sp. DedQUE12b TaxID=3075398 RepID=UPI002AD1F9B3|nr:hypothetical protein [Nostoc sp. DedQUE12b]MDZ8086388.1 hypothetical protein [Nostoc sp. DedQUE12b]
MSDYIRLKSTEAVQEQTPQTLASSHEAAQLAVNSATRVNPALKPAADELKSAIAVTNVSDDACIYNYSVILTL